MCSSLSLAEASNSVDVGPKFKRRRVSKGAETPSMPEGTIHGPTADPTIEDWQLFFLPQSLDTIGSVYPIAKKTEDDNEESSVCSESCSQKNCGPPCADEACEEDCSTSCFGFIDCDETEVCTRLDCVVEECRDDAPPCFDPECLQSLTDEEIEAAANLVASSNSFIDYTIQPAELHPTSYSDVGLGPPPAELQYLFYNQLFYPSMPTSHLPAIVTSVPNSAMPCNEPDLHHLMSPISEHSLSQGSLGTLCPVNDTQFPLKDTQHIIGCQWGENCTEQFSNWTALNRHLLSTHVEPQTQVHCPWNDCRQATDTDEAVGHAINNGYPGEVPHRCARSEANRSMTGLEPPESQYQGIHMPSKLLQCQWASCGASVDNALDLSTHLKTSHFSEPWPTSSIGSRPSSQAATLPSFRCRWLHDVAGQDGEGTTKECEILFGNAAALHKHVKDVHINGLGLKAKLVCRWAECHRGDARVFGQRGKLERHVLAHSGGV